MEVQGSLRLYFWTLLCLLLSVMVEIKSVDIYTIQNRTVLLDSPRCQASYSDIVEWDGGKSRQAKRKTGLTYYNECNTTVAMCTLHQNGSLTLKPTKNTEYTLKVYIKNGTLKCTNTVRVTMEDVLEQPVISYNCTSKGATVRCSSSVRHLSNLTLYWGTKSKNTTEKSVEITVREQKVTFICVAKNRVSQSGGAQTVNCTGWDIYLIASVAGGAVALLIFITLIVYSVKYRPWRSHSRSEEDVEISRLQANTLQRRLPEPPDQASTEYLSGGGSQSDFTERSSIQKPPTPRRQKSQETAPGGRKGKQNKSQRLPPQAPGEIVIMSQAAPNPQNSTPALPGNHPSEQAPRPQPRTQSKPPRHNRKNCQ